MQSDTHRAGEPGKSGEDRLDLLGKKLMSCPRHKALVEEEISLYNRIKAWLTPEMQAVLMEHDDLYGAIIAMHEEFFYAEGFKDGAISCSRKAGKTGCGC